MLYIFFGYMKSTLANIVLSKEQTASSIYLKDVHGGTTAAATTTTTAVAMAAR